MNRLVPAICLLLTLALPVRADDFAQAASRDAGTQARAQTVEWPAVALTADVLYRLLAAELAAQRGQYALASATLLEIARESQDPRLAQRAFQFSMVGRDTPRALAAAQQWLRLAPSDPEASAATLALAASSGQPDGLADALAQRIAQTHDKDQAIAQAAAVVSRLRDKDVALRVLEQALLSAQQNRVMAFMVLSDTAWEARDADRALSYARQAQQRDPASEDAAQRVLEYGVAVDPEAALAQTRRFLQAQPQARRVQLSLVNHLTLRGAIDEALAQLDRIDDPALAFQVALQRASLQGKQGRIAQARATLEGIAPRDGHERVLVALRLASVYRAAGRTDDAVGVLEDALRQDPDSIQIQYDLAMLYERQGRMDAFEERLTRILEIDPDNANANNALGYTLVDQNRRLDEAQVLLERAERLEPDNSYILDSVGWYHYRRGDLDRALVYLRRAYADMPAADVAAHLGEVLWMMRRPDEARSVWQEGQRLEVDNETLQKTLRRLDVTLP